MFFSTNLKCTQSQAVGGGEKKTLSATSPGSCVGDVNGQPFTGGQGRGTGVLWHFNSNGMHLSSLDQVP